MHVLDPTAPGFPGGGLSCSGPPPHRAPHQPPEGPLSRWPGCSGCCWGRCVPSTHQWVRWCLAFPPWVTFPWAAFPDGAEQLFQLPVGTAQGSHPEVLVACQAEDLSSTSEDAALHFGSKMQLLDVLVGSYQLPGAQGVLCPCLLWEPFWSLGIIPAVEIDQSSKSCWGWLQT